MFKFLKEALNELNAPVASPSSNSQTQRTSSPLRQSFSIDPASTNAQGNGRRSSSFSTTTAANIGYLARGSNAGLPGSGGGRQSIGSLSASGLAGAPVARPKSQRRLDREEMEALQGTEEDKLIEGIVGELRKFVGVQEGVFADDLENVIVILEKLHVQLVQHVPAAQGIFRLAKGFPTLRRILRRLGSPNFGKGPGDQGSGSKAEDEADVEDTDSESEDESTDEEVEAPSARSPPGRRRMTLPHTASGLGYSALKRDAIAEQDERDSQGSPGPKSDGESLVIVESGEGEGAVTRLAFPEPRVEESTNETADTPKEEEQADPKEETPPRRTAPMDPSRKFLAIKLCFYVLDAAVANETNRRYFADDEGWKGFGTVIHAVAELANRVDPVEGEGSRISSDPDGEVGGVESSEMRKEDIPNAEVLGILFSATFGGDESLLDLFTRYLPGSDMASGPAKETLPAWPNLLPMSQSLCVANATLLPIIFALLPLPYWIEVDKADPLASKGKEKAKPTAFMTPSQIILEHLVWRVMLVAVHSSWINLFLIQQHLPTLLEGLLDRLYPPDPIEQPAWSLPRKSKVDPRTSFDDTAWKASQKTLDVPEFESGSASSGSRYASSAKLDEEQLLRGSGGFAADFDFREKAEQPLRGILLKFLRRFVKAGIPPQYSHKLFRLAKSTATKRPSAAIATPGETRKQPGKRQRPVRLPSLHLELDQNLQARALPTTSSDQQLDGDMLEIIRHGMSKRWPDIFCFSPQIGGTAGGLFMSDLVRPWPNAQKGYHFMAWVYIEHLAQPITLLHMYDAKRTILRIRIQPDSRVAVLSSPSATAVDREQVESVFQDSDAMIPHRRWVHLGISCRKGKSQSSGTDVKLLINGKRAGTMRSAYPQPTEKTDTRVLLGKDGRHVREPEGISYRGIERSTFFLGTCMLLGEYLPDDLGLLVHHLGPRYQSNLQEPLGRFLTYEAATALNIYLSTLVITSKGNTTSKPVLPTNSHLIKGIREGQLVPEEAILFSFSATNAFQARRRQTRHLTLNVPKFQRKVFNAALPTPMKATETANATAAIGGDVMAYRSASLDEAMSIVGGPIVALRLVELSSTSKELLDSVSILWEAVKESWSASEDMERMRGFDLLAGLLKLKMRKLVDAPVARAVFATLGIDFEKPERSTIHNSAAYKSLTRFDLWSASKPEVTRLYLQQYEMLFSSRHKRFNVLRYFKKAGLVRRMLFAFRAELLDAEAIPVAIDVLQVALSESWSADDAIKPLFAYLVAALCSGKSATTATNAQAVASAILARVPIVAQDQGRLVKLTSTLPVHRVIIVFLSCDPTPEVAESCLEMIQLCLTAPSVQFAKRFESEGGFALLAAVLPELWSRSIASSVIKILIGPDENLNQLACPALFSCVFAALERSLQLAAEPSETTPTSRPASRNSRLSVMSSQISPPIPKPIDSDDDGLNYLLESVRNSCVRSAVFRSCFNAQRLGLLIPLIAEYLSVSATAISIPDTAIAIRQSLLDLMALWQEDSGLESTVVSQLSALSEQIRLTELPSQPPSDGLQKSPSFSSLTGIGSVPSSPTRTTPFGFTSSGRHWRRPRTADRQPSDWRLGGSAKAVFERRMPLKRQLTGESALTERRGKLLSWKNSIVTAEAARFIKTNVEVKEFWTRISKRDWPRQFAVVDSEASLWPTAGNDVHWRLDGTEGSMRKRLKLERALVNSADKSSSFYPRMHRSAVPRSDELGSAISHIGSPVDDDPFAIAMGEAAADRKTPLTQIVEAEDSGACSDSPQAEPSALAKPEPNEEEALNEMVTDTVDKHRRIAQTLQTGDAVEEIFNVSRVVGVDSAPGLLIIGKKNLYLVDGLAQLGNGEIVSSQDASMDVFTIPSGSMAELDASDLQSHRWAYADIVENNKRSFLFRDVAVEFFFADKRNFLCVFKTKKDRQSVLQRILAKIDPSAMKRSALGNLVSDAVAKAIDRSAAELEVLTSRWQRREVSNFAYLQAINQVANRTPNDVTQYPVFPWILQDYTSEALDLQNPAVFRDLSLPMGALTPARRAAATERYQQTQLAGEKPFQFGTHFSSSMIVCSFNIRVSPFTEMFLALQGGSFDLADRLFSSIPQAWESASKESRGDVRELVPEFFYSPLFLQNSNRHDFGRKQGSGDAVDDVLLPPWAFGNPLLFIHRHREALESDWVSRSLPHWIDLIFGYKQHDPAAFTCFHPLSYKDAVDLDSIVDEGEKAASVGIIHNFGQTPAKIFREPHPHRYLFGRTTIPIDQKFGVDEHWLLLIRGAKPLMESTTPLVSIYPPSSPDLPPQALPHGRIPFAQLVTSTLRFGFHDRSLRAYHGSAKMVWISETTPVDQAVFVSSSTLATASPSGVISIWKVHHSGAPYLNEGSNLVVETVLRGHYRSITSLVSCPEWSVLVSCSIDGTAIVWDMDRMRFLRRLRVWPPEPVIFADVHATEGHIVLASRSRLHVFTLNGDHIATMEAAATTLDTYTMSGLPGPAVASSFNGGITFFDKDFSREGPLLAVGQGRDIILLRLAPGTSLDRPWQLQELRRVRGPDRSGNVTALKFLGDALYACIEGVEGSGRSSLHQWSLPEGGARMIAENSITNCMSCNKTFGLLEPRRSCGGCGGVFCSADAVQPAAVVSTLVTEVSESVLVFHKVDDVQDIYHPARLQLALAQSLRSAAIKAERRLIIVLGSATLQQEKLDWSTVQSLLNSVYTGIMQILAAQGKPAVVVDALIEGVSYGRMQLRGKVDHIILSQRGDENDPYLTSLVGPVASIPTTIVASGKATANAADGSHITVQSGPVAEQGKFPVVALGGTFDHLHPGHKILLTMAAYLATRRIIVGLSDDALLRNKAYAEHLEPISIRIAAVKAFLELVDPQHEHVLVPLQDVCGPTATDPDIQALVLSRESLDGGRQIAELRLAKSLPALRDFVIDVVSSSNTDLSNEEDQQRIKELKLSSTAIRRELAKQGGASRQAPVRTPREGPSMKDFGFTMRYCPTCRITVGTGMSVIGSSRRSSVASVRMGGVGSRRGSLI